MYLWIKKKANIVNILIVKLEIMYQTIPTTLKRNESSNFSQLLNASARITFWTLHVRVNFVFRLFNVSLSFQAQSAKKNCRRFAIFNFSEKLQNIFEIGLKNMEWSCKNHSHWKTISKEKIRRQFFCCLCVNLPTVKILGAIGQIPYEF